MVRICRDEMLALGVQIICTETISIFYCTWTHVGKYKWTWQKPSTLAVRAKTRRR